MKPPLFYNMNNPDPNYWLCISIFYNKTAWRELIAGLIKPFLLQQKENIKSFIISFNTEQGDNIRFSIECSTEIDKKEFVNKLHHQLSAFLALHPSDNPIEDYKGKAFFMNFPNNSVQYRLYSIPTTSVPEVMLRTIISERIVNIFADEEFNDSSMIVFILYIIMAFCITWERVFNDDINLKILAILPRYTPEGESDLKEVSYKQWDDLFTENRDMIIEIYNEVFESHNKNESGFHIEQLKDCYSNILPDFVNTNYQKRPVCMPFDNIVIEQISMSRTTLSNIYYIIHLCLATLKNNN